MKEANFLNDMFPDSKRDFIQLNKKYLDTYTTIECQSQTLPYLEIETELSSGKTVGAVSNNYIILHQRGKGLEILTYNSARKEKLTHMMEFKQIPDDVGIFSIEIVQNTIFLIGNQKFYKIDAFSYNVIEIPVELPSYMNKFVTTSSETARIYIWGQNSESRLCYLMEFDTNINSLRELSSEYDNPTLEDASLEYWSGELIICGAKTISSVKFVPSEFIYRFDLEKLIWTSIKPSGHTPPGGVGQSSCVDSHYIYLFGGYIGGFSNFMIWRLDLLVFTWEVVGSLLPLVSKSFFFVKDNIAYTLGGIERVEIVRKRRAKTLRKMSEQLLDAYGTSKCIQFAKIKPTERFLDFSVQCSHYDSHDFKFIVQKGKITKTCHQVFVAQIQSLHGLDSYTYDDISAKSFDLILKFLYLGYFRSDDLCALSKICKFARAVQFVNLERFCIQTAFFATKCETTGDMFEFRDAELGEHFVEKFLLKPVQRGLVFWRDDRDPGYDIGREALKTSLETHPPSKYLLSHYMKELYQSGYLSDFNFRMGKDKRLFVHRSIMGVVNAGPDFMDRHSLKNPETHKLLIDIVRYAYMRIPIKFDGMGTYTLTKYLIEMYCFRFTDEFKVFAHALKNSLKMKKIESFGEYRRELMRYMKKGSTDVVKYVRSLCPTLLTNE
jgi:hypothetical protein